MRYAELLRELQDRGRFFYERFQVPRRPRNSSGCAKKLRRNTTALMHRMVFLIRRLSRLVESPRAD